MKYRERLEGIPKKSVPGLMPWQPEHSWLTWGALYSHPSLFDVHTQTGRSFNKFQDHESLWFLTQAFVSVRPAGERWPQLAFPFPAASANRRHNTVDILGREEKRYAGVIFVLKSSEQRILQERGGFFCRAVTCLKIKSQHTWTDFSSGLLIKVCIDSHWAVTRLRLGAAFIIISTISHSFTA